MTEQYCNRHYFCHVIGDAYLQGRTKLNLRLSVSVMYLLLFTASTTTAHISLTYPAARYPLLDCLKLSGTPVPCGIPRPRNAERTTFYTHIPYNITFRMAYPHQGGYRLSLLDANGSLVQGIWPKRNEDGFAGLDDQTTQNSNNVVFSKPCVNCILRAERQLLEKDDLFQSCADVNIVDGEPQSTRERCSDAGEFVNGSCQCDHLRSGPVCQYKDYCTNNSDCLNGGQCIEEAHSLVQRTCFCAFGYFGINCQRSDVHNTTSGDATADCFNRNYPANGEQFDKYGLFNESCYHVKQLNKDDVVYYRTLGKEIEIILDYQSNTWIGIGWRPIDIDTSCLLFPSEPHSSSEINETVHSSNLQLQLANVNPSVTLNSMNCLDIVIGSVHDGLSRISDHYTRDQSTPLRDSWYGGTESLTAAYGTELDGRTIIMFRRPIEATEKADHSLGPGEKLVVWAKGQETGHYFHHPKSALEASEVEDPIFYKHDVLKYHGKRNRGVHSMEFVITNSASVIIGVSLIQILCTSSSTLLYRLTVSGSDTILAWKMPILL